MSTKLRTPSGAFLQDNSGEMFPPAVPSLVQLGLFHAMLVGSEAPSLKVLLLILNLASSALTVPMSVIDSALDTTRKITFLKMDM
jgi:hypothetical protein